MNLEQQITPSDHQIPSTKKGRTYFLIPKMWLFLKKGFSIFMDLVHNNKSQSHCAPSLSWHAKQQKGAETLTIGHSDEGWSDQAVNSNACVLNTRTPLNWGRCVYVSLCAFVFNSTSPVKLQFSLSGQRLKWLLWWKSISIPCCFTFILKLRVWLLKIYNTRPIVIKHLHALKNVLKHVAPFCWSVYTVSGLANLFFES